MQMKILRIFELLESPQFFGLISKIFENAKGIINPNTRKDDVTAIAADRPKCTTASI